MISWHRFYDPETGRYISGDPIGLAGGMNLYAYVHANPVNAVDPWGLKECTEICTLKKGEFDNNAISHNLWGAPASSLTWHEKCPNEHPVFDSAYLISTGKDPYAPADHPFPWEARELKNGKQVFNVPTRSSHPFAGLGRVRMCYKCCDCE